MRVQSGIVIVIDIHLQSLITGCTRNSVTVYHESNNRQVQLAQVNPYGSGSKPELIRA